MFTLEVLVFVHLLKDCKVSEVRVIVCLVFKRGLSHVYIKLSLRPVKVARLCDLFPRMQVCVFERL